MNKENLPSYLAEAKANPLSNRAPWFKNTAPSYAGIILWFVFWNEIAKCGGVPGGGLAWGIGLPIISIIFAALVCFALFYFVPGMFGLKTGLPLYVVGSSVFGTKGGIIMPGLLMGILQFGWVGVNIFASSVLLHETLSMVPLYVIMIVWGAAATFIGLKGIQYVAKISTYLPLIPLVILIYLIFKTACFVGDFDSAKLVAESVKSAAAASPATAASEPLSQFAIFSIISTVVIGFFATAGAAGVDFGTNARDTKDVALGGLVGVTIAMIFTGVAAVLILAGAYANPEVSQKLFASGSPIVVTETFKALLGDGTAKFLMFMLAIAAFPAACFSSLIAANSFKTMLPKVNSTLAVSVGGIAAIALAISGYAGESAKVFNIIGASFGPICGAMCVDYFMNKCNWSGPRAGLNPAGWLAWAIGFIVGILPFMGVEIPLAPICAFVAGAVVYAICSMIGLKSKVIEDFKA